MTEATDRDNYCYRHPNRQSFILCQRCGRTICSACQTPAAVGVHCPECIKEARQNAPRRRPAVLRVARASSGVPIVTYSLIGINLVVYLLQWLSGSWVIDTFGYAATYTATEPWRMVTSTFLHSQQIILHVLLNMYSLFILGPLIERVVGGTRFLVLYLIAGFGGSVGILLLAPDVYVVGASGAIFGLFGALLVFRRILGVNSTQIFIVIAINLALSFLPGLAWQSHLAGLLVGSGIAAIYLQTRRWNQRFIQFALLFGVLVVLIALTVVRVLAG